MAKLVFDAPEKWYVREEEREIVDEENGSFGNVQEVTVVPYGKKHEVYVVLSFYPDYAPNELGLAEDHIPERLSEYLNRYFPSFYKENYFDKYLFDLKEEGGKHALYFVNQEPGKSEATIELCIDVPLENYATPSYALVYGSIELDSTVMADVHGIVREVVAGVSIQNR